MTDARCEPPPELRGKDGWWWVSLGGGDPEVARWVAEDAFSSPSGWWLNGNDQPHSAEWIERDEGTVTCLEPPLTPAEVAALRAERDAAWNEVKREREKYKDDMHAALVEVARWSQRSGLQDAELTTLRAEAEKLRAELGRTSGHLADFAHAYPNDCTAEIDAALYCARAALEPQP